MDDLGIATVQVGGERPYAIVKSGDLRDEGFNLSGPSPELGSFCFDGGMQEWSFRGPFRERPFDGSQPFGEPVRLGLGNGALATRFR